METRFQQARLDSHEEQIQKLQADVQIIQASIQSVTADQVEQAEFRKMMLVWVKRQGKPIYGGGGLTIGEKSSVYAEHSEFISHPIPYPNLDSSRDQVEKVLLPAFSGYDPHGWITQAELYFEIHGTPFQLRMRLAQLRMLGVAKHWFTIVTEFYDQISWEQFTKELLQRFSGLEFPNPHKQLATIQQQSEGMRAEHRSSASIMRLEDVQPPALGVDHHGVTMVTGNEGGKEKRKTGENIRGYQGTGGFSVVNNPESRNLGFLPNLHPNSSDEQFSSFSIMDGEKGLSMKKGRGNVEKERPSDDLVYEEDHPEFVKLCSFPDPDPKPPDMDLPLFQVNSWEDRSSILGFTKRCVGIQRVTMRPYSYLPKIPPNNRGQDRPSPQVIRELGQGNPNPLISQQRHVTPKLGQGNPNFFVSQQRHIFGSIFCQDPYKTFDLQDNEARSCKDKYRYMNINGEGSRNWKSEGYDAAVFVLVDRLSKYNQFILIKHPYIAKSVAKVFVREVFQHQGTFISIVSVQDSLFFSHFWHKLFRLQGTELHMNYSCLVAVVHPNKHAVESWAHAYDISGDFGSLCEKPKVKEYIVGELNRIGKEKKEKGFEFIKAVHLDPAPFDIVLGSRPFGEYVLVRQFRILIKSSTSLFTSSASTFSSKPSFGSSCIVATSETKSCSSTSGSGPATSLIGPGFGSMFSSQFSVFFFEASSMVSYFVMGYVFFLGALFGFWLDQIGKFFFTPRDVPSRLAKAVSVQTDFVMTDNLTRGLSGFLLEVLRSGLFTWISWIISNREVANTIGGQFPDTSLEDKTLIEGASNDANRGALIRSLSKPRFWKIYSRRPKGLDSEAGPITVTNA